MLCHLVCAYELFITIKYRQIHAAPKCNLRWLQNMYASKSTMHFFLIFRNVCRKNTYDVQYLDVECLIGESGINYVCFRT